MKILLAALLLTVSAACASAPRSLTFGPSDSTGLLVYQFDGWEPIIQPVDVENGRASGSQIRLGNGSTIYSNAIGGGFGTRVLPPGEYAIVNRLGPASPLGAYTDACYDRAAPVFRVKAGAANVLESFEPFADRAERGTQQDAIILESARGAPRNFPGVTAEAGAAESAGLVEFSRAESMDIVRNECGSGSSITRLPTPTIPPRSAP